MDIRFQDVKTVSDMDANQLYHVTRRNSNYRANAVQNYQRYGAVLFSKQDLGNFSRWDGDENDPFTVDFTVSAYDIYNATAATGYPAATTTALQNTPLRLVVTFFTRNYGFAGRYHECMFDFNK